MIYSFENKFIVEQFRSYIPELRKIVYSEDSSLFLVSDRQIVYPSLYFNRESEDWSMSKAIPTICSDAKGNAVTVKFFQVPVNYEGIILAEKQADALELMAKLRFAWENNPYCKVWYPDKSNPFTVELRLKYIRIESERNAGSDIGSQRLIKFAWQSNLFITEKSKVTFVKGFIINVITNDGEIKTIDNYARIS